MPLRLWLRCAIALLLALLPAGIAHATCTVTSPVPTFQESSSYSVQSGGVASINLPAGLSCTSPALSVLGTSFANATLTSTKGFVLSNGTDTIPYQIAADQNFTYTFNQTPTINYMDTRLLALLGIISGNNFTPKIYLRLAGTPNISAGTYTDTISIAWNYAVCNVAVAVCLSYDTGTGTSSMTVTLVVDKECRVSAPDVNLNSAPLVSQFSPVNGAALVDCTKNTTYTVAFDGGVSKLSRPWRTMSDGAGHNLQYNIYLSDGATIWDTTNPQAGTKPGTGGTTATIAQPYVVKVNPSQTTPPAGTYSDTVTLIVTY